MYYCDFVDLAGFYTPWGGPVPPEYWVESMIEDRRRAALESCLPG